MLEAVVGFIVGILFMKVLSLKKSCAHTWKVLYSTSMDKFTPICLSYEAFSVRQTHPDFLNKHRDRVFLIYKKCLNCGEEHLNISDGSEDVISYDGQLVLDIVRARVDKAKEEEIAKTLARFEEPVSQTPQPQERENRGTEPVADSRPNHNADPCPQPDPPAGAAG